MDHLESIERKHSSKETWFSEKQCIFHQYNASANRSKITVTKLSELKYEMFEHPRYIPYLAPRDYYLFRNSKQFVDSFF